jgi:uncharacterized Zn finger protein
VAKRPEKPKRRAYDDEFEYFPPSRPIRAKDGIQSRSQRGAFASNWWAKRWLAVLESYGIDSRLQRGRSYARGGQVLSVDISPGMVKARVQGSRPTPYRVEIHVKMLSDTEWTHALDAIGTQAIFAAQLLDGVMPQDVETAFETARVPLFPKTARELETSCSCPDAANPCKHIAAVYYLLGEQFDIDPFLIFALRGRTQPQIMEAMRQRRASAAQTEGEVDLEARSVITPLDADLSQFWGNEGFTWAAPGFGTPPVNAAVLRRLGVPPGEMGKGLDTLYRAMSMYTLAKMFGGDDV